jgi:DNA-binding transcriptional MerR regulator
MYKIGEFSKITGFSVKTLRYYDEEQILSPSYRKQENSYRYYNEDDYSKAEFIKLLRELNFTISEMKDVLSIYKNKSDLAYILEEKKSMINEKIAQEKALLKKIDLYINPNYKEEDITNYEIQIKRIPSILVSSIRFQGNYSNVGIYISELYKSIKGNANGTPFNCYYDEGYKETADIEICIPTKKKICTSTITSKELPQVRVISTIHYGPYTKINKAYKAVIDYANENGLNCLIPSREVYIKGPGMIFKGNPNNYITEILVPIEFIE